MLPIMPHQAKELAAHGREHARGILFSMGLGKTRVALETAFELRRAGEIDALMVLAPKGVHHSWIHDQAEHLPDDVRVDGLDWWSSRSETATQRTAESRVLNSSYNMMTLPTLSMPYSGIMTERGKLFAQKFLKTRRCMLVLDESHSIKDPGAKRTMRVLAACKYAPYRRILTGTFLADTPFDAYSQIRALDPDAWRHLGISDAGVFRSYFGIIVRRQAGARSYPEVIGYQNLKVLNQVIERYCSHLTKEEVLNLPPKTYVRRSFELDPAQRRVYDAIRKQIRVEYAAGTLTSLLAISKLMRLQQAACGYLPTDDDDELRPICGDRNPRLELLFEVIKETGGRKTIVWAKFTRDIELILERAAREGITAVRYDGRCSPEQLIDAKARFTVGGDAQLFVGNPAAGVPGLNLTAGKVMIYYSCGFKLVHRTQSEDRFHRIGQDDPVTVVDLAGIDTVDDHVIYTLRSKREVVTEAMGDKILEWI